MTRKRLGSRVQRNIVAERPIMTRYLIPSSFIIVGMLALGLACTEIQAEEQRYHEAHEHGVANLNVAVEGTDLYIEFSSPAANIVGFEHHPRTQDQKDAIKEASKKLIPYLSVIENVTLPCRFSRRRRDRAAGRSSGYEAEALRLLNHLGMDASTVIDKPVTELSVGQQQRVAAARALIGGPEILIAEGQREEAVWVYCDNR